MPAEQLRQLLGRIPWLSGVQIAASVIQPRTSCIEPLLILRTYRSPKTMS